MQAISRILTKIKKYSNFFWLFFRRKLHNLVQELRGNIRVYVRVRPLLGGEKAEGMAVKTRKDEEDWVGIVNEEMGVTKEWKFDRVFGPESTQGQDPKNAQL